MTRTGMHVRGIESLDEAAGTCVCFGFGRPEQRTVPHPMRIGDLKADRGIDEIRQMAAVVGNTPPVAERQGYLEGVDDGQDNDDHSAEETTRRAR